MKTDEFLFRAALWGVRRARPILGGTRVRELSRSGWERFVAYQMARAAASSDGREFIMEDTRFRVFDPEAAKREAIGLSLARHLGDSMIPPVERFLDLAPGNGMLAHFVLKTFPKCHVTLWEPSSDRVSALQSNLASQDSYRLHVESDARAFDGWRVPPDFDAVRVLVTDSDSLMQAVDSLRLARWIWLDLAPETRSTAPHIVAMLEQIGFVPFRGDRPTLAMWPAPMPSPENGKDAVALLLAVNGQLLTPEVVGNRSLPAARVSFSQEGEDLILGRLLTQPTGFYVDVGAHDPFRFSNTCGFYLRGWRGLNIDASDQAIQRFAEFRPRDINVHAGVAEQSETLTFFEFDEPALSTFSEARAKELESTTTYRVVRRLPVPVLTLRELLTKHVPDGVAIDFLTVDVEGLDLAALRSSDWTRFRPRVVVVEDLSDTAAIAATSPLVQYMASVGYAIRARTMNSAFFVDSRSRIV